MEAKEFEVTLAVYVDAKDKEEAREIVRKMQDLIYKTYNADSIQLGVR